MEETATTVQLEAVASKPRRERGDGSPFHPKWKDKHGQVRSCPNWYIQYYRHGVRFVENTHSDKITVAKEQLKKRLGEIAVGQFTPPHAEKVRVEQLAEELLRDYRVNGRKSLEIAEQKWRKYLKPSFGTLRAVDITTDTLNRYVESRLAQGAQNATVNRELAMVRRMFYLAYHSTPRKIHQVPNFPRLDENPPREGFVDDAQYGRLCKACTELWIRALLAAAYTFGFRKGELLGMRVRQVDLLNRTITLDPGTTKNKKGRVVKMTEEVYRLLTECVRNKKPEHYVFTREGNSPVRDFRRAWAKLCAAAGLQERLFHDLRRSAVRNMVRSGVSEQVAMKISGHMTRAVFDRYDITSEADLAEAAHRIERSRAENDQSTAKVAIEEANSQGQQSQLTN